PATVAKVDYRDPTPDAAPVLEPTEFVWIDDELPAGAKPEGNTPWEFVTKENFPVLSGTKAATRTATDLSQHFFTGASPTLKIGADDRLFAWVWLDPKNPPKTVMLQFNDGAWEHRA
ncbi:MAG: hypothetical protein ACKPHU_30290, partial [Planctomycetaceae bacterium]